MNKFLRQVSVLTLLISAVFLSGCWDQKQFEDIGFILQLGLELKEEIMSKY